MKHRRMIKFMYKPNQNDQINSNNKSIKKSLQNKIIGRAIGIIKNYKFERFQKNIGHLHCQD